ncbi:hypothetical protein FUAX_48910 (plasmid) [Fulvitalea axinellae]|uniref:DUF3021 domain-containing protein n=1 Tax=Fulvitalea axinellae TaxID=1182444 RepID=A0AAU9D1A1_9BACT|nr:hypothetical protein FUAX_48910 [Fulvitalea axinellae]
MPTLMARLKTYLIVNAVSSAVLGLSFTLFSSGVQSFLGFKHPLVLPILGAILLILSVLTFTATLLKKHNKTLVNTISAFGLIWVMVSAQIVFLGAFNLSLIAYICISIIAVWIGFLSYRQYYFNKKIGITR